MPEKNQIIAEKKLPPIGKQTIIPTNETLNYYDENAISFSESTLHVDFTETQQAFLNCLPSHAGILDFGCGAGRDTRYFLEQGCEDTTMSRRRKTAEV